MDLALNNLQRLICHKTQQTNQPTKPTFTYFIFDSTNSWHVNKVCVHIENIFVIHPTSKELETPWVHDESCHGK